MSSSMVRLVFFNQNKKCPTLYIYLLIVEAFLSERYLHNERKNLDWFLTSKVCVVRGYDIWRHRNLSH